MKRWLLLGAGLLVACGGSKVRDATTPLSAAGARVQVVKEAKAPCKKLGTAIGRGHDLDEKVSEQQAIDGAREEAAKLGGDTIVFVTQTNNATAGSGGTYVDIDKTADVYVCTGGPAK